MKSESVLSDIICEFVDLCYPESSCVVLTGSCVKGTEDKNSDVDLVVLYEDDALRAAFREKLIFRETEFEVFAHSPSTFKYFVEKIEKPSGVGALLNMVAIGKVIGGDENLFERCKTHAIESINQGPDKLGQKAICKKKLRLIEAISDLRTDSRSVVGDLLAADMIMKYLDYELASHGEWTGSGKSLLQQYKSSKNSLLQLDSFKSIDELTFAISNKIETMRDFLGDDGYFEEAPDSWRL